MMILSLENDNDAFDLIETENLVTAYEFIVKHGLYEYEHDYEFSDALVKACSKHNDYELDAKNKPHYYITLRDPNAPGKAWVFEMDAWTEIDED